MGVRWRSELPRMRVSNFAGALIVAMFFRCVRHGASFKNRLWLDEEFPLAHDHLVFNPDIEAQPHHVDMGRRAPRRAGVFSVWITKRDVDAGKLLILQDVANHALHAD